MEPDLHMMRRRRKTELQKLFETVYPQPRPPPRPPQPREYREWEHNVWLPLEGDDVPTQDDYDVCMITTITSILKNGSNTKTGKKITNDKGEEVDEIDWRIADPDARIKYQKYQILSKNTKRSRIGE
jgi:hypothetical protein